MGGRYSSLYSAGGRLPVRRPAAPKRRVAPFCGYVSHPGFSLSWAGWQDDGNGESWSHRTIVRPHEGPGT